MLRSPKNLIRGLTLVETLAGAVILIVIVALLLPVTNMIGQRNDTIKCMANLRFMHTGMMSYLNDHNGAFPPYRENWPQPDGTTLRGEFWSTKIRPYLSLDSKSFPKCPAEKIFPANHYAMNVAITSEGVRRRERLAETELPSKRYLFADAANTTRITAVNFPTEGAFRHKDDRINLVFIDGHVESRALKELPIPANGFTKTHPEYKAFFNGKL